MNQILLILAVTITGQLIGSAIGVLKKPSDVVMFNMLSFAAGIMLSISFLQLIPQGLALSSAFFCSFGILCGAVVMFGFDRALPHFHHSFHEQEPGPKLKKTAFYLLVGIFIHNIPEGMAIGLGAATDFRLSLAIALAIGIHDIPEAICTSAPYYYVTKKRLKSFLMSLSTVIPTLIGFLVTYFFLASLPLSIMGILMGATAGLMIYVSADELIPISSSKLCGHSTIFSLIAGIVSVILVGLL